MDGVATIRSSIATIVIVYNAENEALRNSFTKLRLYLEKGMLPAHIFKYLT
jgi:hypothetical protein